MHAIDTNVLVRLISRDDLEQTIRAEEDIKNGAWVSHIVLLESVWVLQSVYGLNKEKIRLIIEMLLKHNRLIFQYVDVIELALLQYKNKPKLGFSDCLI
ncbi:MAG TPA: PIN domain-containing protein, partial [Trueperaceae bacterium]|nr:PIN domain-containing protein [Trueperaceae bacterium]